MWLAGTLELTSKIRYGITSRGVPIFRFIPYDKRYPPLAVGCSQRDLFYNVHVIVEPTSEPPRPGMLQKANLIQNLGPPTNKSELQLLLTTYVYDGNKELRSYPPAEDRAPLPPARPKLKGYTFHIDPPGCRDVDDSFTLEEIDKDTWNVAINIADVAELVSEGSSIDLAARARATSFYTPEGTIVASMLPSSVEALASLLPGTPKLTVSLCFQWKNETIQGIYWALTETMTTTSYTYEEADAAAAAPALKVLSAITKSLKTSAPSGYNHGSHEWVEAMMIFYNKEAGKLLAGAGAGILRKHKEGKEFIQIPGVPEFLAYEAAEYCLPNAADTYHSGLDTNAYAYASSPIRRYADLVNQRSIKDILNGRSGPLVEQILVDQLNRRQKQAKAFSRDLFFMTNLSQKSAHEERGIVVDQKKGKTKVWVSSWNRLITVKSLGQKALEPGSPVGIQWYECREEPRWKERMVFTILP
jgi:hypothetical protein